MTEERVQEYLNKYNRLFKVIFIDAIRDGGTKLIDTTKGDRFYIHQNNNTFHDDYPPNKDNQITDQLLIDYIINEMEKYNERMFNDFIRNKKLINEIIIGK